MQDRGSYTLYRGGKLGLSHLSGGCVEQEKPVALCANDHILRVQPFLQVHEGPLRVNAEVAEVLLCLTAACGQHSDENIKLCQDADLVTQTVGTGEMEVRGGSRRQRPYHTPATASRGTRSPGGRWVPC